MIALLVCTSHNPLQCGRGQPYVGVDDAIMYLVQKAYTYLDRPNTSVYIIFFDFSVSSATSNPTGWGLNWRPCAWVQHLSFGSMTIWRADVSLWGFRTASDRQISNLGATPGTAASLHHSLCMYWTDSVICRNVQMTRPSWCLCVGWGVDRVRGEPSAAERDKTEKDDGGLCKEQCPALSSLHQWERCGLCGYI